MKNAEREFTALVKEYRKTIYTVCYFFSKDSDEVKDLFQEVLANLWRGFEQFRGESSVRTWVWRVSLNTCNHIERKKRRSVQTVPLSVGRDLYHDNDDQSRQIRQLYDRINRLEAFDRAIILLWLESMSYEEIAAVVGISVANVGTRLSRIREQLKKMSN